jgi:hypothetical protein
MEYSGAWGELIHERNLKSKISWHCPFKLPFARKKLYKLKIAAQCPSLSTGIYILRKTHRSVLIIFIESAALFMAGKV